MFDTSVLIDPTQSGNRRRIYPDVSLELKTKYG
jgi:hypothetical protein